MHNVEQLTRQWFEQVVLGLNLCPFAHRPARQQQIRFHVSTSENEDQLIEELMDEITALEKTPPSECETTLLIVPSLLDDFYAYQFFLQEANRHLKRNQWLGVFQLASFHPDYAFAGTDPEDASNLTNRSPYPIIHILREDSLSAVLERVDNPEDIPANNMETMENMSEDQRRKLFSYLGNLRGREEKD